MLRKIVLESREITFIDSSLSQVNFSTEKVINTGLYQQQAICRLLTRFEFAALPLNCIIEKAELKLYCVKNEYMENNMLFTAHPLLEDWKVADVTWDTAPSYDNFKKTSTKLDCNYWETISWNITDFVRQWHANPEDNFGLLIKADNEEVYNSLIGFLGVKGYSEWQPKLEITYSVEIQKNITNISNKVAILTPYFFEWDGGRCLFGGGERYLVDLVNLLEKLNYQVDVFQPSNGDYWERSYNGLTIKGISVTGSEEEALICLNKKFYLQAIDYDYHIYFNVEVAYPNTFPGSICISQGVWWETEVERREGWRSKAGYQKILKILDDINLFVSIDTNFINLINALKPNAKCQKAFVPNYVDLALFKPGRYRKNPNKRRYSRRFKPIFNKHHINILYPRKLHPGRGWSYCKEVAVELIHKYKNIRFIFVGRGSREAEEHMAILSAKYPRIEYKWYEMDDMYKAYQEADIVLIPSFYSEGTSLSLLEAMACGKAIITGYIGGLSYLVVDGFNGLLINLNKENLKNAIETLINDNRLRKQLGYNARESAYQFSKDKWERSWGEILNDYFPI